MRPAFFAIAAALTLSGCSFAVAGGAETSCEHIVQIVQEYGSRCHEQTGDYDCSGVVVDMSSEKDCARALRALPCPAPHGLAFPSECAIRAVSL